MIKAIVVDDERLVRKGFISLFDWPSFGIIIVGEAADGRAALELLEQLEVDLVFTDITMPGLSGFDLIKQIRQRYKAIRSVVLTCHHEFDFVQEALRLGAIDYIVKTLLEPENANDVMNRIADRMKWEEGHRGSPLQEGSKERIPAAAALLFYPMHDGESCDELFRLPIVKRNPILELTQMWLVPLIYSARIEEVNRELALLLGSGWKPVWIIDLSDEPVEEVKRTLNAAIADYIFYKSDTAEPLRVSYKELLQSLASASSQEQIADCLAEGYELKWTMFTSEWELFVRWLEEQRLPMERLSAFGEALCMGWSGLVMSVKEAALLQEEIRRNRSWSDWKIWIRRYSDNVQRRMLELSLSKEVMFCLIKAISYMRGQANGKLNQADVADYVKMSRSYFSQCFSKFAGMPFGVMLRGMRVERAKKLLLETDSPVYEIAYLVGFEDDKYFSKLFREHVGQLPTEYRAEAEKAFR